jgi:flagellar biosynthesis/type III secretory pathway protein FliH
MFFKTLITKLFKIETNYQEGYNKGYLDGYKKASEDNCEKQERHKKTVIYSSDNLPTQEEI